MLFLSLSFVSSERRILKIYSFIKFQSMNFPSYFAERRKREHKISSALETIQSFRHRKPFFGPSVCLCECASEWAKQQSIRAFVWTPNVHMQMLFCAFRKTNPARNFLYWFSFVHFARTRSLFLCCCRFIFSFVCSWHFRLDFSVWNKQAPFACRMLQPQFFSLSRCVFRLSIKHLNLPLARNCWLTVRLTVKAPKML